MFINCVTLHVPAAVTAQLPKFINLNLWIYNPLPQGPSKLHLQGKKGLNNWDEMQSMQSTKKERSIISMPSYKPDSD